MAVCRTVEEAYQAGWDDAADMPPLSQDQADLVAAILASARQPVKAAA